jgi:hypothetical protein
MNPSAQRKLKELRSDYSEVVGTSFKHFFCPILLKDEQAQLCKAHIVNQAFGNSSNKWTLQRADVDNFYGSVFEADFIDLKYREGAIENFINEPSSAKSMQPVLHLRGEKVDYYLTEGPVPANHSQIVVKGKSAQIRLALKLHPDITLQTVSDEWQIAIEKDCRIPALVSVLKAAHLALFEMLGYRYALSAGGLFLGRSILGRFFLENDGLPKKEVIKNAESYFIGYVNLVRPVLIPEAITLDAVNDRSMYLCEDSARWAFLLFIRTSGLVHAVLVPLLESPDASARFANFLGAKSGMIQARLCQFNGDSFQIAPDAVMMAWPEANWRRSG